MNDTSEIDKSFVERHFSARLGIFCLRCQLTNNRKKVTRALFLVNAIFILRHLRQ